MSNLIHDVRVDVVTKGFNTLWFTLGLISFIFVDNEIKKQNNNGAWWKPAIEIFSKVSGWIVVPIVLALIVGKNLDARFDTEPWIFLIFALVGFLVSSFGIYRVVVKYVEKIKELGEENKNN